MIESHGALVHCRRRLPPHPLLVAYLEYLQLPCYGMPCWHVTVVFSGAVCPSSGMLHQRIPPRGQQVVCRGVEQDHQREVRCVLKSDAVPWVPNDHFLYAVAEDSPSLFVNRCTLNRVGLALAQYRAMCKEAVWWVATPTGHS
jgi:hypothetical protein